MPARNRHLRAVQPSEGCQHTWTSPGGRTWTCSRRTHNTPATRTHHWMSR